MNKIRLNLIVRTLLLPFIQYEFLPKGKDPIAHLAETYYQADNCASSSSINQKRHLEQDYALAKASLEQFIWQDRKLNAKSIDDVLLLIELFYSQAKVARYVKSVLENECAEIEDVIAGYYINRLFHMADSLLTFRDGRMAIRTWINEEGENRRKDLFDYHDTFDKVEIWNIMGRLIVPDVIIAAFFIEAGLTERQY